MAAPLDKNFSLVVAEKGGYFKAYRTFNATSGANHVVIKLLKKTVSGTINSTSEGTVSLANGSKITLPANSVVQASTGNAYSGTIHIYAASIDPTAADIGQTVPGSFMANDKEGKRVSLASYGMLAVELEGTSGEKLQIREGSTATLATPILPSLQSSAPATIPLWYLDEQTGIWKEEGRATKNGTVYVGDVKHFSFWNYDIGIPAITLSMTLKTNNGVPLVHVPIKISRIGVSLSGQAYGWTDSLGQVSGLVPANERLILQVLDPCGLTLYAQNIGPYTQNTDLGTVAVTSSTGSSIITLKGKLVNCSGSVITKGYAIIYFGNTVRYAAVDANGNFSRAFLRCSGSAATCHILGVDESAQQQGSTTAATIIAPVTDAGTISACGNSAAQYINYKLDGTDYTINSAANDSLTAYTLMTITPTTYIGGYSRSTNATINFKFNGSTTAGTYPVTNLSVQNFGTITLTQPFNVVVTNFPQSTGQFYEGNLSGQFKDAQNATHTISGSFRIRKQW